MPAVTVLSLGSDTLNTARPGSTPHLVDKMPSSEGRDSNRPASSGNEASGSSGKKSEGQERKRDDALANPENDKSRNGESNNGGSRAGNVSPSTSSNSYPPVPLPAHQTPQQGYYLAYSQTQVTPEPPSPAGPAGTAGYDVGSFLQQPTGFHASPFAAHPYQAQPGQAPNSPSQNTSSTMGGIPPASPLFPRVPAGQANAALLDQHRMLDGTVPTQRGAPLSPGPPYMASPQLPPAGAGGMYMGGYAGPGGPGGAANNNNNGNNSPEDFSSWGDNRNLPHDSPQMGAQGFPGPYVPGMPQRSANAAGRTYSFEENMLPPSAESQQNQDQQGYGQNNHPMGGAPPSTLFGQQQPWGYGGPPPEMYGASASTLQPRPAMPYPGMHGGPPRGVPPHMAGPYGTNYYPATSPGPPIQTTTSNKGPDGANLFIFHIPNHFTNLDMYQLFCPYGSLLSVRIMVEKDTGRSRGFGFVSYDSPDAAALAIKELNGFAIGNKRLKVQHKQIRPSDQQHERNNSHGGGGGGGYDNNNMSGGGYAGGRGHANALPPSGPMAINAGWYGRGQPGGPQDHPHHGGPGPDGQSHDDGPNHHQGVPADGDGGDPLNNLEPLRQALPEVGGNAEHVK